MRFGVDEAGKGPVLGSMFAAAVRGPAHELPNGIDDSKRLTPERRETLDRAIREADGVTVGVAEIPVSRIDGAEDMNTLTVAAQAEALSQVVQAGDGGVIDAGDTSTERFAERVRKRLSVKTELRAEHHADESYLLVGAASIVAKVARDAHVAALAEQYGDVGSGYPSDPNTRTFLADYVAEHGALPPCARTSWSTCDDVLAAAQQSSLGEF
ncbi:ribonuclease HII [Salinirubellus salinus]|jgi:ribonuclease HII|uniref:Ribonuclease HII n=1 Tax=Salinirubellus salinus TaxID=1364945 RepID=A0A9E7UD90_9EURY|nr:ribonuclease HII [Salinirubellus salinus]UWM56794.1 ribonuclease HII [Salinirubellus salinus]